MGIMQEEVLRKMSSEAEAIHITTNISIIIIKAEAEDGGVKKIGIIRRWIFLWIFHSKKNIVIKQWHNDRAKTIENNGLSNLTQCPPIVLDYVIGFINCGGWGGAPCRNEIGVNKEMAVAAKQIVGDVWRWKKSSFPEHTTPATNLCHSTNLHIYPLPSLGVIFDSFLIFPSATVQFWSLPQLVRLVRWQTSLWALSSLSYLDWHIV